MKIIILSFLLFLLCFCSPKNFKYEKEINFFQNNFKSTEIKFTNTEEQIHLSGTLIEPIVDFKKLVIIVPGSGKDKRNAHYKLAENLLTQQIAVFRYDDRGVGNSKGNFNKASTQNFANDLKYCVRHLKNISNLNGKKIGLIGHSEGGDMCQIVCAQDKDISFLVLLGTLTIPYLQDAIIFSGGIEEINKLHFNNFEEERGFYSGLDNIIMSEVSIREKKRQ